MTTPHQHEPFPTPDEPADRFGADGHTTNGALLGELAGAAFDGCMPCQNERVGMMVNDRVSLVRLIELACGAVANHHGGLPRGMTDLDAPGMAAPAFRRAAAAGVDGQHVAMFEVVKNFNPDDVKDAADTALDLVSGYLFPPPVSVRP